MQLEWNRETNDDGTPALAITGHAAAPIGAGTRTLTVRIEGVTSLNQPPGWKLDLNPASIDPKTLAQLGWSLPPAGQESDTATIHCRRLDNAMDLSNITADLLEMNAEWRDEGGTGIENLEQNIAYHTAQFVGALPPRLQPANR